MNVAGQFPFHASAKDNDSYSGALSMLQLRAFLGREWRLISAVTAFLILLGTTYVVVAPNRYTARADMIIDTKKIVWVQSEMTSESRGIDDAAVESEMETTKSEKVAGAVARRLHLTEDPEFVGSGPGLGHRLLSLLGLATDKKPTEDDLLRDALATLSSNLRVSRLGRSYHEEIAYTSLDPAKAATGYRTGDKGTNTSRRATRENNDCVFRAMGSRPARCQTCQQKRVPRPPKYAISL